MSDSNQLSNEESEAFIPFFNGLDDDESAEEHRGPLMLNELPVPWLDNQPHRLDKRAPPFVRLHNEILTFCQFITPTTQELRTREKVVVEVNQLAKSIWPQCTVHLFGSQYTKILTPTSDIDIAILDVPIPEGKSLTDALILLAEKIHEKINVTYLEAVVGARVPIIKFDHAESGLSVDICLNNDSGLRTGQLMKQMTRDFPPLLPLTLVLKTFLVNITALF
jgi:non-canonical poly(A) RNA polymerase PAPD5/7